MESEKLCFTTKHCSKSPKTNFYGPNMTQLICGGSHHALSFFLSLSRSVARNEYLIPAVWHDFFSPITCHTSSYIYFKMLFFCVWISLSFLIDPSESAAGRQRSTERPGHQWKPKISRRGLGVVEWQPGDHWLELFLLGKSTISMGYHGISWLVGGFKHGFYFPLHI